MNLSQILNKKLKILIKLRNQDTINAKKDIRVVKFLNNGFLISKIKKNKNLRLNKNS